MAKAMSAACAAAVSSRVARFDRIEHELSATGPKEGPSTFQGVVTLLGGYELQVDDLPLIALTPGGLLVIPGTILVWLVGIALPGTSVSATAPCSVLVVSW